MNGDCVSIAIRCEGLIICFNPSFQSSYLDWFDFPHFCVFLLVYIFFFLVFLTKVTIFDPKLGEKDNLNEWRFYIYCDSFRT